MDTPNIELRNNRQGRLRAYLRGSRVRVQDIYVLAELQGMTADEIAVSFPHLTLAQIHAALSYYFEHRDEILEEVREDEAFAAAMKSQFGPGPLEAKLGSKDLPRDPISS